MKVQIGVENSSSHDVTPEDVDLYLGLEDIIGAGRFNLLVAEQLVARVEQRRMEVGKPASRADQSGRLSAILDALQPQPDKLGMVAYQTKQGYILHVMGFGGVVPDIFPVDVEVPEEMQPMVKGLLTTP